MFLLLSFTSFSLYILRLKVSVVIRANELNIKEVSGLIFGDLLSPKMSSPRIVCYLKIFAGRVYVNLENGFIFLIINDNMVESVRKILKL